MSVFGMHEKAIERFSIRYAELMRRIESMCEDVSAFLPYIDTIKEYIELRTMGSKLRAAMPHQVFKGGKEVKYDFGAFTSAADDAVKKLDRFEEKVVKAYLRFLYEHHVSRAESLHNKVVEIKAHDPSALNSLPKAVRRDKTQDRIGEKWEALGGTGVFVRADDPEAVLRPEEVSTATFPVVERRTTLLTRQLILDAEDLKKECRIYLDQETQIDDLFEAAKKAPQPQQAVALQPASPFDGLTLLKFMELLDAKQVSFSKLGNYQSSYDKKCGYYGTEYLIDQSTYYIHTHSSKKGVVLAGHLKSDENRYKVGKSPTLVGKGLKKVCDALGVVCISIAQ